VATSEQRQRSGWIERLPWAALVLGTSFWFFDAAVDAHLLDSGSFAESAFEPEPAEIWMRSLLIATLVAGSLHTRALLDRYRAARDGAETADRAKSVFLGNMSHEIRTPLTAIIGYTEVVLEGGDLSRIPRERLEALHAIRRNGEHLVRLVNDVLDVSRLEAGRFAVESIPFAPLALAVEAASLLDTSARASGLELSVEQPTPIPEEIRGDPTGLRRVLVNLIGNAIKFSERGQVRVVVRCAGSQPNARLRFEVHDTGIGIPAESLSQIFDAFTQADASMVRRYGGSGLGLHISRGLVEAMGGALDVESEPSRGSTFSVSLPLRSSEQLQWVPAGTAATAWPDREAQASRSPVAAPRLRGRVLLAEDSADVRRLVEWILRRLGAQVDTVKNGREANEMALAALDDGEPYDVVFMDVQMPVLDGLDATRVLRAEGYELPIVALTAQTLAGDRDRCLEAGCDDYVSKPIDRDRMTEVVSRFLAPDKLDSEPSL
jgi:signal transduction histidine kinase/ActR/RegA family two-component response regulator